MGAAVVLAVLLAPAVQQVQEERVVAREYVVPAGQQRELQRAAAPSGRDPQAAVDQFADQDPAFHRNGAGRHQGAVPGLGDVVVVAVERPFRNAGGRREGVQFLERGVRNQVREVGSVGRPKRRVEVDGHG